MTVVLVGGFLLAPPLLAVTLQGGVQEKTAVPTTTLHASTKMPNVRLDGSGFYYTTDFEARYLKQKQLWRDGNPGRIPTLTDMVAWADRAYEAPRGQSVERPLARWNMREDPSPWVFRPKVLLANTSKTDTELDLQVVSKVEARIGQWLVDPRTMLANLDYLQHTSRWQTLSENVQDVPVLASNEELLLTLPAIQLLKLFATPAPGPKGQASRSRWPVELKLTITIAAADVSVWDQAKSETRLLLIPDHMALPLYLY